MAKGGVEMSEAKATARPWRVDGRYVKSDARPTNPICELPHGGIIHQGTDRANARLIVSAVNSHDMALELARVVLAAGRRNGNLITWKFDALEASQVLAKRLLEQAGEKS